MDLFTYGTLMFPAVWERVAQEECPARRAVLHGHEARRLEGFDFPGLVKCEGASTPGLLYGGVSDDAMRRLDEYEDECYVRVPVTVELEDGSRTAAQVYLVQPAYLHLVLPERWQPLGK